LLTEDRERLRRRYLLRQSVPDTGPSNRECPVTDCWTSDRCHHHDWCHQSVVSVGPAFRQQEQVVPYTAAHFRVKLCTSAQRPCNRSAPGRSGQWRQARASVMWSADLIR